jgi:hypothetical protein
LFLLAVPGGVIAEFYASASPALKSHTGFASIANPIAIGIDKFIAAASPAFARHFQSVVNAVAVLVAKFALRRLCLSGFRESRIG